MQITIASSAKIQDFKEFEPLLKKNKSKAVREAKRLTKADKVRMVEDLSSWNTNRALDLAIFFLENGKA